MNEVYCQEVIICTKQRRGNGIDKPIRAVLEVFDKSGKIIAEADPLMEFESADLLSFAKYCHEKQATPCQNIISEWLKSTR